MTTSTVEEQSSVQPQSPPQKPKPPQRATVAAAKGHLAASKAKSARKPRTAKKGVKARRKAGNARPGSKTAKILDLLKRPGGATSKELWKATSWHCGGVAAQIQLMAKAISKSAVSYRVPISSKPSNARRASNTLRASRSTWAKPTSTTSCWS